MIIGKNISNKSLGVYDDGVLINNFGIKDEKELEKIERNVSARRLAYLYLEPIEGRFDIEHLKEIHKFIFSSLYPFAGQIREIDISKPGTLFCRPAFIESMLKETLTKMHKDITKCKTLDEFAKFIAFYYSEINLIHPFREGNGRTLREFIREYIDKVTPHLEFGKCKIEYSKMDSKILLFSTIEGSHGKLDNLEKVFFNAISPIEKKLKKDKLL